MEDAVTGPRMNNKKGATDSKRLDVKGVDSRGVKSVDSKRLDPKVVDSQGVDSKGVDVKKVDIKKVDIKEIDDMNKSEDSSNNSSDVPTMVKSLEKLRTGQSLENTKDDSLAATKTITQVDLQKLEYGTRTLQKNIRLIINESPDFNELESIALSPATDQFTRVELQQNPLITLAAKLKSKYKLGELNVFEDILESNVKLTSAEREKLQVLADSESIHLEIASLGPHTITAHKGLKGDKPPLPRIQDAQLYERVFIHKSTINSKSYLNQHELINLHNERLEFLGDSILNNLVTLIIYDRYPGVSEGELTKIRSHLIDNRTLAEFSFEYGLNQKLKANINEEILRCGDQKIYADIFEAYVGALGIEKGFDLSEVKEWLTALYEKKLHVFDTQFDGQPLNKEAKTELYSVVGTAQFHPTYHIIAKGDGVNHAFTIECRMGDDILGVGTASNQKDAGLRAAMSALNNRQLLEKYHKMRLAIDRKDLIKSNKRLKFGDADEIEDEVPVAVNKKRKPTNDFMSRSQLLPVRGNDDDPLDNDAKNRLYAEMGKKIGEVPQYVVTTTNGAVQVEVQIKGYTVAIATDKLKKKAMTRAAMALINKPEAIEEICRNV